MECDGWIMKPQTTALGEEDIHMQQRPRWDEILEWEMLVSMLDHHPIDA